jgi:hypothetical protein
VYFENGWSLQLIVHWRLFFIPYNTIVIYIISGIKAILQDSSVKIADDEGVSPSLSVTHEFPLICFSPRVMYVDVATAEAGPVVEPDLWTRRWSRVGADRRLEFPPAPRASE